MGSNCIACSGLFKSDGGTMSAGQKGTGSNGVTSPGISESDGSTIGAGR